MPTIDIWRQGKLPQYKRESMGVACQSFSSLATVVAVFKKLATYRIP